MRVSTASMTRVAWLACVALFWGASAIQLQQEKTVMPMRDDCHTAVDGEDCYHHVEWSMTRGIKFHSERFPNTLSESSSFEEFQAYLHGLDRLADVCKMPCKGATKPEQLMVAPAPLQAQPPAQPCRTAVQGEDCFTEVYWAMREGFVQHPDWYPGLTSDSTFEDFQAFLHNLDNATHVCAKPCEAQGEERLANELCHTSVEGEECFKEVTWAMQEGYGAHPDWYPELNIFSTFEDFQTFLHSQNAFSHLCSRPCKATPPGEQPIAEEDSNKRLRMPMAEETEECHTSVEGDDCYHEVSWAMKTGIVEHPKWYQPLTSASTFQDFQAYLHSLPTFSKVCAKPCDVQKREDQPTADARTQQDQPTAKDEATQEEAARQAAAEEAAKAEAKEQECRTAVAGDECYKQVDWAMKTGIVEHPEWYPSLTTASSFEDFQAYIHSLPSTTGASPVARAARGPCTRPCAAQTQESQPPADARKQENQPPADAPTQQDQPPVDAPTQQDQPPADAPTQQDQPPAAEEQDDADESPAVGAEAQTENCHTTVQGERCYKKVSWAMERGLRFHPDRYPGLTTSSSFEEIQKFLHQKKKICPPPCAKVAAGSQQDGAVAAAEETEAQVAAEAAAAAAAAEEVAATAPQAGAAETKAEGTSETAISPEVPSQEAPLLEDENDEGAAGAGKPAPPSADPAGAPGLDANHGEEDTPPLLSAQEPLVRDEVLAPLDFVPSARETQPAPPIEKPTNQGCYMSQPTGCTNHPTMGSKRGEWVEEPRAKDTGSFGDEILCQKRIDALNGWCGVENTKMLWIPPATPETPSEKGCYVWRPSGCPKQNQPAATQEWKHDTYAEQKAGATGSEEACMKRKSQQDHYCGTTTARMLYVG